MTILLEIAVVAAIVFGAVAYVLGQFDSMRPAPPESGAVGIPDGPVEAAAIDRTRFGLSFRGYRMDEVDAVLDRLRDELARHESPTVAATDDEQPAADEPQHEQAETPDEAAVVAHHEKPETPIVPQHEPGADEAPTGDPDGPWPS